MQKKVDQASSFNTEYLQYGSEISLSYQDCGYISSSGFIDNLLYLKPGNEYLDFSQCLFRILPYCIHSIQNSLLSDIQNLHADTIYNYQEKFYKISESLEGEIQSNLVNYEKTRGEYIRFGSLVYFQHVASHKFLTVIPNETGIIEKYSLKVALTDFPNDYSYVKIEPSYNFQREGEGYIRINDIVQLEVFLNVLNKAAYINTSSKPIPKDSHEVAVDIDGREVNASLDNKIKWRINLFNFTPRDKQKLLNYGDCIWISHSEGGVIFTTMQSDEGVFMFFNKNLNDSNGLWRVEKANYIGGHVYTDESFLLRHVVSGLYLSFINDESKNKQVGILTSKKDDSCFWKFQSIYDWEKHVKVEIDHFFYLINCQEGFRLQGIEDNEHLAFIRLEFSKKSSEAAFFKLFKADANFLWETLFTINSAQVISKYFEFTKEIHKIEEANAKDASKFMKKRTDIIIYCLKEMGKFLRHSLTSSFSTNKNYGQIDLGRQKIFKEVLIIDLLSNMLDIIFSGNFNLGKIYHSAEDEPEKLGQSESTKFITKCLMKATKKIYKVLGITCQDNNSNQIYAFKFFPVYQKHGGYNLGATNCMKSVLMNNEKLMSCLEEGSLAVQLGQRGASVIEHYIWLLRKFSKERKPHLIEFLSNVCGCSDMGIAVNQNVIHERIFYNPQTYNKGIIATSIDAESKALNVVLRSKNGIGEDNVALLSCFQGGEIKEDFKSEIMYLTHMLRLFANLCKGRNSNCKTSISKWFPIDVLTNNIWDKQLSTEIRAAFLEMMMNMHIDESPRVLAKKPELIRTAVKHKAKFTTIFSHRHSIENINQMLSLYPATRKTLAIRRKLEPDEPAPVQQFTSRDEIRPDDSELPIFSFKCELIKYLKEITSPKFDILLLQMLKAANLLVNFEVISTEISYLEEKRTIYNVKNNQEMDIISLLKGANKILFYKFNPRISPLKNVKGPIQELKEKTVGKGKEVKTNADDPFRRFSEGLRHFLKYHTMRSADESEVENIEIKCKLELCDLLNHGLDLRQDFLISNVIAFFSTNQEENFDTETFIPSLITSHQRKEEKTRFKCYHNPMIEHLTSINPIIFEQFLQLFITTKNYKLQTKILGIVFRMFSQRRELMKNLKKITFMVHHNDPEIYFNSKIQVSVVKNYADKAAIMCHYWKTQTQYHSLSLDSINRFLDLLKVFKKLMYLSYARKEISPDRQVMLRYLSFQNILVKFISDGFASFEDIYDDPKNPDEQEAKKILTKLFRRIFKVLKIFLKNNKKNQHLLFNHLEILLKTLRIKIGQIELICEIFVENHELCNKIDEKLINIFIEMILNEGKRPEFLYFFDTVVMISNEPIPHLQRMILSALTKKNHLDSLLDMKGNKFLFTSNLIDEGPKDIPFHYHEVLIRLLAKCGLASCGFKLNQIKCQKLISFDYIYDLLQRTGDYNIIHTSLIEFLLSIYMTQDSYTEATETDKFLKIIKNQRGILQKKKENEKIDLKFLQKLILMLHRFVKLTVESYQTQPENLLELEQILYEKHETFKIDVNGEVKNLLVLMKDLFKNNKEFTQPIIEELNFLLGFYEEEERIFLKDEEESESENQGYAKSKWLDFVSNLSGQKFSKMIKDEQAEFLKMFSNMKGNSSDISPERIFQGLLEYISLSTIHKPPNNILCSVVEFLGFNLNEIESEGKDKDQIAKEKLETQNKFRDMNVVQIIMKIMCYKDIDPEIFAILIDFSTKLLDGGNEKIQQDFYDFFIISTASENFFSAVYTRISDFTSKISVISDHERKNSKFFRKSRKVISKIIKLMQLFCENHFDNLQNYLRNQEKSRINYDLVGAVILLLRELMVKKRIEYFHIMSNCFGLLTECIQGPCKMNQKAIINSKFLEIVSELLSIDEQSKSIESYEGLNTLYSEGVIEGNMLAGWMISHLKYKCLITLIALLEGRTDNYVIIRMFRAFNLLLFKKNLISIYSLYIDYYSGEVYNEDVFGHFNENDSYKYSSKENKQDKNQKYYSIIIEIGFMIFQLLMYFTLIEESDIKRTMNAEFPELYAVETESEFQLFNFNIIEKGFSSAVRFLSKQNKKTDEAVLENSIKFFQDKTRSIEIIFKSTIYKMYFWLPPVCNYLSNDSKKEFHDQADRTSEKAKIEYLVNRFPKVLDDMLYEKSLSNVIGYRLLSSKIAVFKALLFILTLYLNVLILISYNDYEGDRLSNPRIGFITENISDIYKVSPEETWIHLYSVGIVHCVLSCLIFLYFTIKTIPLLIKTELREMKTSENSNRSLQVAKVIWLCLLKIDVIYQFGFFIFSILGLAWHPFFFAIHVLDILYRIPSLQSVIMSVVLPWKSLVLTLFLIIIINYLFAIWAYSSLSEGFYNNCDSLLMCFKTIFDQGYKNAGGIGMWIDFMDIGNVPPTPNNLLVTRFFFDDIYMIIIPILMSNIIYGLILDTFAVLKQQNDESRVDKENKCFICGKLKEDIERLTSKSFHYHVTADHCEWNYLFFIAYLKYKEKTEHSGLESYIQASIDISEVDWIPQQQGLNFRIEQEEELNSNLNQVQDINDSLVKIEQDIKKIKKVARVF